MIVKALMSTSELPSPSRAIITSTGPSSGQRDHQEQRGRPQQHPEAEVHGQAPTGGEHQGEEPADQPADAQHGVEEPDARLLHVEQVEGDRHAEHERGARDHRLRAVEAHQQGEVAAAPDLAEAGSGAVEDAVGPIVGVALRGSAASSSAIGSSASIAAGHPQGRHEEGGPEERERR